MSKTVTVLVPDTDGPNAVVVGGISYDSVGGEITVPAADVQSFLLRVPGAHVKDSNSEPAAPSPKTGPKE